MVQCDGCRVLVHMECYGVTAAPDGSPWLCRVCELGLAAPPPCVLCPVVGGALKPTSCGRWAHVTCAMWVPETTFGDAAAMEPIGNVRGIRAARL